MTKNQKGIEISVLKPCIGDIDVSGSKKNNTQLFKPETTNQNKTKTV